MGRPGLDWSQIPLARAMDTRALDLEAGPGLSAPGCVSMGNPHLVFFVTDALAAPATTIGPVLEHDPLFPQGVNVGFAQVLARDSYLQARQASRRRPPAAAQTAPAQTVRSPPSRLPLHRIPIVTKATPSSAKLRH
jgi:hypothetical protein